MSQSSDKRAEFIRSLEAYSTPDICRFADEILRKYNEDASAAETQPRTEWPSPEGEIHLSAREFDTIHPTYRLHLKRAHAIGEHVMYIFSDTADAPSLYDTNHEPVNPTTPFENSITLMAHLRSHPFVSEPQNNRRATAIFRQTMAHLALDHAQEVGTLSLPDIAALNSGKNALFGHENSKNAVKIASESALTFDNLEAHQEFNGKSFFFTRLTQTIEMALEEQIMRVRAQYIALSPAPNDDTQH